MTRKILPLILIGLSSMTLGACNTFDRAAAIGSPPQMTRVENPVRRPEYQPISMPMPRPATAPRYANSLWRPGARAFLKDQRASSVGDIVTVAIQISDSAKISNKTTRPATILRTQTYQRWGVWKHSYRSCYRKP